MMNVTGIENNAANIYTTMLPRLLRRGTALRILRKGEKNK
jgi:hypothetical protein